MDIQDIKLRFGIIGTSPLLDRAIDIARQVASTDMTVLITGESGTGKEAFPKIIHNLSARKHGSYIAVNCGAIPEGTIDSELFGHEKGSFTGAHEARKGYFEVANKGTIFLDEVAELPLSTQVRLLRVLESGEFIRVGSSKVIKTDVRVVGATNIDVTNAIRTGKFREDLYYRLNNVPIYIPPLRERKEDIPLLFRKFASDFAENYRMPPTQLDNEALKLLVSYRWPGNVRQLKNVTEQISLIESSRNITANILLKYLPQVKNSDLPVLFRDSGMDNKISERELLYKVLFDMKKDINDLKTLVSDIIDQQGLNKNVKENLNTAIINKKYYDDANFIINTETEDKSNEDFANQDINVVEPEHQPETEPEVVEEPEPMSFQQSEVELIKKALQKFNGKRRKAAKELGISERTLYRKMKDNDIEI